MTTRRRFMAAGGFAAAATVSNAVAQQPAAPAILTGRQEWRMVTSWPKGLPGVGVGAERIARRIELLSGGRISIKVYAAGELVPALQCFDAVSAGTADLAHDAAYYHTSKSEACAFFTAFPFGFTANELDAWIHHGGGQALWDEVYAPFGIKPFLAGNTGVQMFGWFRREITTPADLKGLKFRTPGNNGRVISRLGAVPVTVPGGEIFSNLQSGALDGAEWIGPANDLALGFYQVAPFYYSPGYHEPGAGLQLMVNRARYDSLPPDLQAVIATTAQAANSDMLADYTALSGPALATLVQKHNVQLRRLSPELLTALAAAANEVLIEIHEGGTPLVRRVVESYLQFRNAVVPWTRISEGAYGEARTATPWQTLGLRNP
jgi:TRAP-type mannitol/chloroaromatic compound transport system substrate-binding protein